jgi:stage III sporulation protein AH
MKVWKKNAVLATVILFVCVAVYLNWSYGRGEAALGDDPGDIGSGDVLNPGDAILADGEGEDALVSLDGERDLAESTVKSDYFDSARLQRQQARDSSLEILRQSAENENLSQESRDKAAVELSELAQNAVSEAQIESLVRAKGFRDCVAFISDDGVEVVVAAMGTGLEPEDVSKIKDIVVSETGVSVADITIIEVSE